MISNRAQFPVLRVVADAALSGALAWWVVVSAARPTSNSSHKHFVTSVPLLEKVINACRDNILAAFSKAAGARGGIHV